MSVKKYDLIGKKFGKWTVIKLLNQKPNNHNRFWLCKCDCGIEKDVPTDQLINKTNTQCRKCADNQRIIKGRKIPSELWRNLLIHAKKRNIQVYITQDDIYKKLIDQNFKCALTELPIRFAETEKAHRNKETTASVDRIDSSQDYTIDNIQLVIKDINFMKRDLSQEQFINYCKLVAESFTKKTASIQKR